MAAIDSLYTLQRRKYKASFTLLRLGKSQKNLAIRFPDCFFLGHGHRENPIFHRSLDLVHLGIFRQPKPPHEFATAPLHAMPSIILVFLLDIPLSADLENSIIFNLNLHFLFSEAWKIGLENMGFWGFLPINASVNKTEFSSRGRRGRKREVLERVPHVKRERIKEAAPSVAKETWDHRHHELQEGGGSVISDIELLSEIFCFCLFSTQ
uniref:Uncharacterized protein n=1 Tax=Salix viminalis TaxID=40686 RepID=A0A6N2KH51_SALVM